MSNSVANAVFQKLQYAYMDSPTFDLGYVFDWPAPHPVTHHVVQRELRWHDYDAFKSDVIALV